jgi:LmbE family N-acetylglucosaminyl deacetylase
MTANITLATPGNSVLVIQAHPDDEAFAAGAAIPALVAQGAQVTLCLATGGEAGELGSGVHSATPLSFAQARAKRMEKLEKSCAALGITAWQWLTKEGRWVDAGGKPAETEPLFGHVLSKKDIPELSTAIKKVVATYQPELILTVGEDGLTGHPDHLLIHQAVVDAGRKLGSMAPRILGTRIRAEDVAHAQRILSPFTNGKPVGSGRIRGCDRETRLITVHHETDSTHPRRKALDAYAPGLGSTELGQLLRTHPGRGDSLLLRGLFDAVGWSHDHFEEYHPSGVESISQSLE